MTLEEAATILYSFQSRRDAGEPVCKICGEYSSSQICYACSRPCPKCVGEYKRGRRQGIEETVKVVGICAMRILGNEQDAQAIANEVEYRKLEEAKP